MSPLVSQSMAAILPFAIGSGSGYDTVILSVGSRIACDGTHGLGKLFSFVTGNAC